ncbi:MAG: glycoside hydrolase family 16 protein [Akkermansiaceae bacterium]
MNRYLFLLYSFFTAVIAVSNACEQNVIPSLPKSAKLALHEDWSSGKIDPSRWYRLRKQWGKGNAGVVPENVSVVRDMVNGKGQSVLQCSANGDLYDGSVTGQWKKKARVGGVIVSKQHFASGRFEVVMKIGTPENPQPAGMVPAIWTYGYRMVKIKTDKPNNFHRKHPLYHPYLQEWGAGQAFYWSEIDFPEFGKKGDYKTPMYNTFLNKQHHSTTFDAHGAADGNYHTYTTEWRTGLVPIHGVKDSQVAEAEGFYWVQDKSIPYKNYWGSPLKRLGKDKYAVCRGLTATHWIDGKYIGKNTKLVPAMSGQLNLGVWLPEWAGPAKWKTSTVRFASIKVWQYNDPGDVKGILTDDITNNFDQSGNPVRH